MGEGSSWKGRDLSSLKQHLSSGVLVAAVETLIRGASSSQITSTANGHQRHGPRNLPYQAHLRQLEQAGRVVGGPDNPRGPGSAGVGACAAGRRCLCVLLCKLFAVCRRLPLNVAGTAAWGGEAHPRGEEAGPALGLMDRGTAPLVPPPSRWRCPPRAFETRSRGFLRDAQPEGRAVLSRGSSGWPALLCRGGAQLVQRALGPVQATAAYWKLHSIISMVTVWSYIV